MSFQTNIYSDYQRKILRQRPLSFMNSSKTNRKTSRKLHIIEICCSHILMPAKLVKSFPNTLFHIRMENNEFIYSIKFLKANYKTDMVPNIKAQKVLY